MTTTEATPSEAEKLSLHIYITPEVYDKVKKFAEYAALEVVACPVPVIAHIAWLFWPGVALTIALLTYGSPILVGPGFVGEKLSMALGR